jgi:hypothetical protein
MNPVLTTRQPPYRSARPTQFSLSWHRRDVGYWQFASIRTNPLNGRYRIVRHRRECIGSEWPKSAIMIGTLLALRVALGATADFRKALIWNNAPI